MFLGCETDYRNFYKNELEDFGIKIFGDLLISKNLQKIDTSDLLVNIHLLKLIKIVNGRQLRPRILSENIRVIRFVNYLIAGDGMSYLGLLFLQLKSIIPRI